MPYRLSIITAIASFTFSCLSFASSDSELNIYMWEDTIAPELIDKWHQTSTSQLNFSHFDNDDERSLLMVKSDQLPFDVVVLDNVSAHIYGELGALEDLSQLKNRHHNDPVWNNSCGPHAVPYFWGTVGVVYRKDKVTSPPKTWQEFVNPPKQLEGHIGMINDTMETFLPLFNSLGIPLETENEEILRSTYPKLLEFNDKVLTYEYILSFVRSDIDAEKLHIALAYSGDQHSLNRYHDNDKWAYILPEGSAYIWVDCLAISAHSANKAEAKKFIDFISDPKNAATNATAIKAATPNLSALKLVPEWYLNDASLVSGQTLIEQGQIDTPLSARNISLRAKVINRILKRHETQH